MSNLKAKGFLCRFMMVMFLSSVFIQSQSYADIVSTDQLASQATADLQREELQTLFAREDVANQLTDLGVNSVDAIDRVAAMTDAEVNTLYNQMNDLPAGADALGTIAIVLVILILLDVAGVTDIFPKI